MRQDEYLTSNTEIAFPFRDGQEIPDNVRRLFVDARISGSYTEASLAYVKYDAGLSKLTFRLHGDDTIYECGTAYGDTRTAYGKVEDAETGNAFVVDLWHLQGVGSFEHDFENGGQCVLFEPSCVDEDAGSVESLTVYEEEDGVLTARTVDGNVLLKSGYNVELSADVDSIAIEAGPGLGLGTVPCDECAQDADTDGHPLPTDDGHAVIAGDECYEVVVRGLVHGQDEEDEESDEPVDSGEDLGYSSEFNTIQIVGKCVACCQCQQFVDVVNVLKEVAQRVVDAKNEITGARTSDYNGLVEDLDKKIGSPEVDIQIDISPDSAVLEYATAKQDGQDVPSLANTQNTVYFRVTCVVTNLSGVPCAIGVSDGGKGNGLSVSLGSNKINNAGSSNGDVGGWLVYSKIRGTQFRKEDGQTGDTNVDYTDIGSMKTASWTDGDAALAWDALSKKALSDLHAGLNKSAMTEQTKDMQLSNQYTKGAGFMMAPGYSFSITNLYAVFASNLPASKTVQAQFSCNLFAPMLLYAKAYNTAKPTTEILESTDGGHYTKTTWTLPEAGIDASGTSLRTMSASMSYDFGNNSYGAS